MRRTLLSIATLVALLAGAPTVTFSAPHATIPEGTIESIAGYHNWMISVTAH